MRFVKKADTIRKKETVQKSTSNMSKLLKFEPASSAVSVSNPQLALPVLFLQENARKIEYKLQQRCYNRELF